MSSTVGEKPDTERRSDRAGRATGVLRRVGEEFLRHREATILLVAVALIIYFQSAKSAFLSHDNLVNMSQGTAPYAITAVGEVLLLVSGEIDLSAGMVFTIAPFLMHYLIDFYGFPALAAIVVALAGCAVIGLVNGLLTVVLRVPSFVATLGMMFLIQGLTLTTSHAYPAEIPAKARDWPVGSARPTGPSSFGAC